MSDQDNDNRLITVLFVIIGVFFVFPMLFMGVGPMMGGMGDAGMWGAGTMPGWIIFLGMVMQLLFFAAILGGGYLLFKAVIGDDSEDQALEELRVAFARGELTEEEYEQRREALEEDS